MHAKILQKNTILLKTCGPQIWLCLFMFRPITLKHLSCLTAIHTCTFRCLGGLEVMYLTVVWQVLGSISASGKSFCVCFLFACLKNMIYYGNTCSGRVASTEFPLSKSKSFCPVFIKLGEYVGGHNISNKFYNQPNPPCTHELWLLNCPKLGFTLSK